MKAEVDMMCVAKGITMNVTLKKMKQFQFRLWLGRKLIILAARIMNMAIEIKEELDLKQINPEKMERPKPWPDPPKESNGKTRTHG